jgi:hypothetical protein
MRLAPAAALLALCLSAPALATGGLLCRPVSGEGPTLGLVIGHGVGAGIAGANLTEHGQIRSTFKEQDGLHIGQSWIDSQRVWLDLVDANAMRHELKLRALFQPKMRFRPALGTLSGDGRTWNVRCEES